MRKLLTSIFTAVTLLVTPAIAETKGTDFYVNTTGYWGVHGYTGDDNLNPACYASVTWDDGSEFQFIKDLATGEVYMWIYNTEWEIGDALGEYSLRMNIETRSKVFSGTYYYQLINKNTIVIGNLNVDEFLPLFMDGNVMKLVMPGTIQNAYIQLDGSTAAMVQIAECIKESQNTQLYFKPSATPDTQPEAPANGNKVGV